MIALKDTRNFAFDHPLSRALSSEGFLRLPNDTMVVVNEFNPMTGSPSQVTFTRANPSEGPLIARALELMTLTSSSFGFADERPAEFAADPQVQTTSDGAQAVHLHQQYHQVPVFQMTKIVHFASDKSPVDAVGDHVGVDPLTSVMPVVSAPEAAIAAAQYLASGTGDTALTAPKDQFGEPLVSKPLDVSMFKPVTLASFPIPSRATLIDKGPFAAVIPAHLVLFYQGPKMLLGWHFVFTLPEGQGQYAVIVGADDRRLEVLYCQERSWTARARAEVFRTSPPGERESIEMPMQVSSYPIHNPAKPLPAAFPGDWVSTDSARGNNTNAVLGDSTRTYRGRVVGGTLTFAPARAPAESTNNEQKVLNIFYFCNYMHDFFYMLGFDEEAGNFQQSNLVDRGLGNDAVLAKAHPGAVRGTANMSTSVDGVSPLMNMGLVTSTGRHTALDADVVFHEFVHGVTNRLVGGPLNDGALEQPQSRGMGEGWSDYFSLTIQNHGQATERTVVGSWVVNNPKGIRGFPYDEHFPDHFGKLGTGRYYGEEHNIGEIWCAALVQMNRNLGAVLGNKDLGHELGWQLVVDALKLTRANPSFLDARAAILRALDQRHMNPTRAESADQRRALRAALWQTFAKYGMGPNARTRGASLTEVVADFSVPADL